jgi:hypothetical protein
MAWGAGGHKPPRKHGDIEPWVRLDALERRIILTLLRMRYREARAAGQPMRAAGIAELGARVKSAGRGQMIPQIGLD